MQPGPLTTEPLYQRSRRAPTRLSPEGIPAPSAGEPPDEDRDVGAAGDARTCRGLLVDDGAVLCRIGRLPEENERLQSSLPDRARGRSLILAGDVGNADRRSRVRPVRDGNG